ncbi:MAG: IS66 family insertion sequence hypothetical protein [Nitrospirae bacterium CG_4_10_14_3_um_filter_44_29]|nr:MAG: IS66 family insertion sequence hypothetical protein [Nitrospirae bacterium CG_4_10_14_3_um_filter_44_29]
MIQLTPQMRILVAIEAVDFRRGIDGLARLCRDLLNTDPFSGKVFVFRSRRHTAIKILVYDGQGFWLCHKRLSQGRFRRWPSAFGKNSKSLSPLELQVLFFGGDPETVETVPIWKKVFGND